RVMDSLIFAASMLFLLWVLGVQGSLRSADQGVGLRVLAAYLNVALLGGGLVFMTSYHPDRVRGPLGWLAASALAWLAALTAWTLSGLPSVIAREGWIILAGAIPLFQGLAAWSSRSVEEVLIGGSPDRRVAGLLPYLPVTLAVLTFAALLTWSPSNVTRGTFAIFLVMVVLLLLRQFQAIQDLRAARRTLEVRVIERTRALEQAQDTLLRTERMNTLALMGAGLAHDLNNLLTAVRSSAELVALNMEAGTGPKPQDLSRIVVAADSAAQLTGRLMAFARREAEDLLPMDLGLGVREMEATLRLLVPPAIDLRIEVAQESALIVRTSRLRLEQMLVNLVANAGDAMPRGGKLTIRVQAGPGEDYAMVEVIDSGLGMSPATLERIFDPFFTTKAPGKGTGLGLPSLKALLDESGGSLTVQSELGKGSRFRILLPVIPALELNPR
ncbi:MAG TPA: ATP-binding protein, partial [Geothrix sp.]|nr:ATP-binding protein [Geothrix sp.]